MEKNYSVINYRDVHKLEFLDFCKKASLDTSMPAHKNMWKEDWQQDPSTLPYLLEIEKRFSDDNGEFVVLTHGKEIVACSGAYRSDFSDMIAIVGVRSWVNAEYRSRFLLGKYLYPAHVEWAKNNNFKQVVITFNEYNEKLKNVFLRNGLGVIKNRKPTSLFFNGVNELDFPVKIKNTRQFILYEKLDPNWDFDYQTIKYY